MTHGLVLARSSRTDRRRRVNSSGTALDDEVHELARDDDRLPDLLAVQVRLHPLATPARARPARPRTASAETSTRSRTRPFTWTTSSNVSRSSSARSASGHGCSHSRSCPSTSHSSSATCGAYGWISETAVSAAKRAPGAVGSSRQLVDELHHRRDRRVELKRRPMSSVTLRDRLVRLARQRRRRRRRRRRALGDLVHEPPQPPQEARDRPRRPSSVHSMSWSAGPMKRM